MHCYGQGDDPLCPRHVVARWRHGEDEPALTQADRFDQQFITGAGKHDYVTGVEITRQDLLHHGRGRYSTPDVIRHPPWHVFQLHR